MLVTYCFADFSICSMSDTDGTMGSGFPESSEPGSVETIDTDDMINSGIVPPRLQSRSYDLLTIQTTDPGASKVDCDRVVASLARHGPINLVRHFYCEVYGFSCFYDYCHF